VHPADSPRRGLLFIGVGVAKGGEAAPMAFVGTIFAVSAGAIIVLCRPSVKALFEAGA